MNSDNYKCVLLYMRSPVYVKGWRGILLSPPPVMKQLLFPEPINFHRPRSPCLAPPSNIHSRFWLAVLYPYIHTHSPFPLRLTSTLNTAKGCPSETLVPTYQTTRCHNPEKSSPPWKIQIVHVMNQYYKLVFLNTLLLKRVRSYFTIKNVSNNLMIIKSVAF